MGPTARSVPVTVFAVGCRDISEGTVAAASCDGGARWTVPAPGSSDPSVPFPEPGPDPVPSAPTRASPGFSGTLLRLSPGREGSGTGRALSLGPPSRPPRGSAFPVPSDPSGLSLLSSGADTSRPGRFLPSPGRLPALEGWTEGEKDDIAAATAAAAERKGRGAEEGTGDGGGGGDEGDERAVSRAGTSNRPAAAS